MIFLLIILIISSLQKKIQSIGSPEIGDKINQISSMYTMNVSQRVTLQISWTSRVIKKLSWSILGHLVENVRNLNMNITLFSDIKNQFNYQREVDNEIE